MTGTDLSAVVDKLAEKLNVAVDRLHPVAQEVLEQYVVRQWFGAYCCLGAALLLAGVFLLFLRSALKYEPGTDSFALRFAVGAASLVLALLLTPIGLSNMCRAIAPLPPILGL